MALVAYPSSSSEASSGDERDAERPSGRRSASPQRAAQQHARKPAAAQASKPLNGQAQASSSQRRLPAPFASSSRPLIAGREQRTTWTEERAKRLAPGLVPGQWLCYVFAELPAETALAKHLRKASDALSASLASSDLDRIAEPHISLSRPLAIENAERVGFAQGAKAALRETPRRHSTTVAFARYTTLVNDDSSRLFFAVEVGMGWQALRAIAQTLDAALHPFGLQPYYAESRFHASFASVALPADAEQRSAVEARAEAACAKLESEHGETLRRLELHIARIGVTVGDKTHVCRLSR